jgi:hypothetical protein
MVTVFVTVCLVTNFFLQIFYLTKIWGNFKNNNKSNNRIVNFFSKKISLEKGLEESVFYIWMSITTC